MSSMTFAQKSFKAKAPEKGSFPLDHDGECKGFMLKFMMCLRVNDNDNAKCRQESMEYLGCRMDHGLMKRESWDNLGFGDIAPKEPVAASKESAPNAAVGKPTPVGLDSSTQAASSTAPPS